MALGGGRPDPARPAAGPRPQADSPWAYPPQRSHHAPVDADQPPVPRQQQADGGSIPGWYPLPAPPVSGGPLPPGSHPARPADVPPADAGSATADPTPAGLADAAGTAPTAGPAPGTTAPPPVGDSRPHADLPADDAVPTAEAAPAGTGVPADRIAPMDRSGPASAAGPAGPASGPADAAGPAGGPAGPGGPAGLGGGPADRPAGAGGPATRFGPEPPNLPPHVHQFHGGAYHVGEQPAEPGDATWTNGQVGPPGGAYAGNGDPTFAPADGPPPSGWAPLPAATPPGWPVSGGWATAAAPGPAASGPPAGQHHPAPAQPDGLTAEPAPPRVPTPPASYSEPLWSDGATPTAEDFARRRQARPADPVATMGVRAVLNRTTLGLVKLPPGRHEQEVKHDIEMVRRNFGGLRQVTVVNPKGGAGKTVAILLLAMTFGQKRGGYVLAWDNNETQGTLGMRAQQDFHARTVRDMLRDLAQFQGAHGRVGDLSQYVRSQGEGMFDVLASDESATGGEMLTASAFAEIRDVVSRFYKLIFVDTGNNVRAQNWQAAMDATDQLVVTMSARNDSAETAARMLDHLEQSGRQRLVRQAVTVVSMPPSRKEIDLPAIQEHFAARTRAVLLAPYERLIDTGEPIRYGQLSSATRDAWLKIAASVAEGL
ncbi:chromosome partitioning protein [Micromonospora echinospora]|uniref:MinD/ParA family ATP-binding protein n=1 Tax=Micromonospora echinospora TaxID=1877 RepID=UPI0039C08075